MTIESRTGYRVIGVVAVMLSGAGGFAHSQLGPGMGSGGPPAMPPSLGARVGYDVDVKVWSVGGQFRYGVLPGLAIMPSADFFLSEEAADWQINLDGALAVLPVLYAGGGFALTRDSLPDSPGPKTEFGYSLLVGLQAPLPDIPILPYAEARWTSVNRVVSPFRIVVGLNVLLGSRESRRR